MKTPLIKSGSALGRNLKRLKYLGALVAGLSALVTVNAQTTVGIDPTYSWIGYMAVFGINSDGSPNYGAYQFGQPWGTADLRAYFGGTNVYLTLNTNVWETNDTYWVLDGAANKWMDALFYVQNDTLAGQEVTFIGTCATNTLNVPNATSVAFIKDLTPSYGSSYESTVALVSGQSFSINLYTTAGDHVQYGFETQGPDVNPTNLANTGIVILDEGSPDPSVAPIASQSAVQGQNITFTAVAKGTSPFAYQWSFGGETIDGATASTLTLTNVQSTNAGTYSVLVTNTVGTAEATAALTVVALSQVQTNILLDPGFESGQLAASPTAGWVGFNGTFFANTNDTYNDDLTNDVTVVDGTNCFGVYSEGAGSYNGCYQDRPALPGQVYTGYIWMLLSPGPAQFVTGSSDICYLEVQFRDSTDANVLEDYQSAQITASTPPGVWMKMIPTNVFMGNGFTPAGTSTLIVSPPNTAWVRFQVTYHAESGGNVYADAADLRLREPVATTALSASQFQISFPTLFGPVYNVLYKNHLTDASWTLLTSVTGDGTVKTVNDVRTGAQRFYTVNTQ
jgi:hypothetical protein